MTPFSSPKIHRLGLMLALCLVHEASAPAPALAWFGWLDEWSGPGKFWGLLYEMRLVCFGPDSGIVEVVAAYQRAQQSTQLVLTPPEKPDNVLRDAVTDWQAAFTVLHVAQIRWNAPKVDETTRVLGAIQKFLNPEITNAQGEKQTINALLKILVTDADKVMRLAIESRAGQMVTIGATGMFWSACSDEKERRISIEFNVNDWHSFDNENNAKFSGGTSIRFVTVMPSVTWRMFANQKADIVDIGVAAGYYAFSSKGFNTVGGFIVEPLRIDLHAPSSWASYPRTDAKRLASMFTFRAGLMTIPGGFASNAFARGSHVGPIKAEIVPTVGFFVNLNSLLAKKPLAPTIPKPLDPGAGASRP